MAATSSTRPIAAAKKGFVRTEIPTSERVASGAILLILVGIGIAIFISGRNFDPNRFSLREGALDFTAAEVEGKAATIRETPVQAIVAPAAALEEEEYGAMEEGYGELAETAAMPNEPMDVAVEGLEPLGDTEFYNEETLFEKINGRAPAYIEFQFQNLRARSFIITGSSGSYVDVLEFEMGSPISAFGIFSTERDGTGAPLDFVADGYASEMGYFLRQGPRYVQIIASDQNAETMRLAEAIARDRVASLPEDNQGLDARRRLPETGLKTDTVEFIQANAFGQAALRDVFHASYGTEHGEVSFFVMVGEPAEIDAAREGYREFSEKFGKILETFESGNGKGFVGESFGNWIAIYTRDNEIGGVVESASAEAAKAFVLRHLETSGVDSPAQ